jgi:uncharacterized protein YqeY
MIGVNMMLKELINKKFIEEFKTRDAVRKYPYEVLKQRIMVAEKSGQFELPLTDEQITNLIIKEIKEREDVLQFYKPEDDAYKMAVAIIKELEQYLPKQMTEEEVIAIIKRIKETEPNLGKVIGLTVKEVGNSFDKSKIAILVKSV